jgi:hypothetical protein
MLVTKYDLTYYKFLLTSDEEATKATKRCLFLKIIDRVWCFGFCEGADLRIAL